MKYIISFLLLMFFVSCSSSKKSVDIEHLQNLFGYDHTLDFNIDSTFVVATKLNGKSNSQNIFPLNFLLYRISTDSIVFKGSYPGGKVEWLNNHQVQVNIIPGNISDEQNENDLSFIYDLEKNEKLKINGD